MSTKEIVLDYLRTIKPTVDLENVKDIIDGSYLDSLELMSLISALTDRFELDLDIEWITPENFNSVDAIANLIDQVKLHEGRE